MGDQQQEERCGLYERGKLRRGSTVRQTLSDRPRDHNGRISRRSDESLLLVQGRYRKQFVDPSFGEQRDRLDGTRKHSTDQRHSRDTKLSLFNRRRLYAFQAGLYQRQGECGHRRRDCAVRRRHARVRADKRSRRRCHLVSGHQPRRGRLLVRGAGDGWLGGHRRFQRDQGEHSRRAAADRPLHVANRARRRNLHMRCRDSGDERRSGDGDQRDRFRRHRRCMVAACGGLHLHADRHRPRRADFHLHRAGQGRLERAA